MLPAEGPSQVQIGFLWRASLVQFTFPKMLAAEKNFNPGAHSQRGMPMLLTVGFEREIFSNRPLGPHERSTLGKSADFPPAIITAP